MTRHLVYGFEGFFRRVMYVFDDAIVFVSPPPSVTVADALSFAVTKVKGMHGPSFHGDGAVKTLANQYVKRRKFKDIAEFSRQFGTAGFSDSRITSTMLAEQLERTVRIPHSEIERVHFNCHRGALHPRVVVVLAGAGAARPLEFHMRYRIPKVRQADEALASVLGSRVVPLSLP